LAGIGEVLQRIMDDWTSKQLPERLPFSKKRLPKKVIFSCVATCKQKRSSG
jgi:hypothetical protein